MKIASLAIYLVTTKKLKRCTFFVVTKYIASEAVFIFYYARI